MRAWVQELDADTEEVISEKEETVPDEFMGRIAAQTAKQVIYQKLRDAEREMTYEEFAGREGDIVTGIIQQDPTEVHAARPRARSRPSCRRPSRFRPSRTDHGERLKAYIVEVRKTTKGPQIVVSRTHPGLLRALFELEVPEVAEGIVEIKAVAREPGHRSKIAVTSQRAGRRPRGRVRRRQGLARADGRQRAARREDRRRGVDGRPAEVRGQRAAPGQGQGGPGRPGDR